MNSKTEYRTKHKAELMDYLETVQGEHITVSDVCTNCNSELLWSHRATKGHRGTMCAFMCLIEN